MKRFKSIAINILNKYRRLLLHPLEVIHLESTNYCNLSCTTCQRKQVMTRRKQHMDPVLARKVIDEASEIGVKCIYLHMWGEPLLNDKLEDIISYAVSKGIPAVRCTSNGTLLTPERSRSLILSGLHELTISVIGNTPQNYASLMQGAHLERVSSNIEQFLALRKSLNRSTPRLKIQTILMDSTANELKAFYEYWQPRVDGISLNYIVQPSCLSVNFSQELTELQTTVDRNKRLVCDMPFYIMTILVDGSIVSSCCEDINGESVIGNATKDRLQTVWNSQGYQSLRKAIRARRYDGIPICSNCESTYTDIVQFRGNKVEQFKKSVLRTPGK